MNRNLIQTVLTIAILLGITSVLYLYTSGYRLNREPQDPVDFEQTGMISAKSIPEGASIYLDGTLLTATDDTISSLLPGEYTLRIKKNGFVPWEKTVEVFPELVTDITAVLVSESPRLEPLTNTGARHPNISPSLSKVAFFSKDPTSPGVWVIPLVEGGLNLFRSSANNALEDTLNTQFSEGTEIEWSPDEQNLLIELPQGEESIYYVVDINDQTAEATASPELLRASWTEELLKKRADVIEQIDIPEDIRKIAVREDSVWAPDNNKFLYKIEKEGATEYRVYNMEKPIPVGEQKDNLVFVVNEGETAPKVSWYADSFHLILTEGDIEENREGSISLIRIDGTNKTEVYNSTMFSDRVFSAPGGDKLIIVTSFKSNKQTDLYTVGLR